MSMSFYHQGYKKLAQIIFEWQDADRAALLSLFIVFELMLHWVWCLVIGLNLSAFGRYIEIPLFKMLWLGSTLTAVFFTWLTYHFYHLRHSAQVLSRFQCILTIVYSLYISALTVMMGYSGLIAGVSLVGSTMLAMLLIDRRMVWYAFISYIVLIVTLTVLPYFGIPLPNLRKLPEHTLYIENLTNPTTTKTKVVAIHEHLVALTSTERGQEGLAHSSNDTILSGETAVDLPRDNVLFWRLSYLYFSLPKAIIITFLFRVLLLIIERNKRNIQYSADHDGLTGIKNRRCIMNWIEQTLFDDQQSSGHRQDYSILLIDLDFFKAINDTYGHQTGDQVLNDIAQLLDQALVRHHGVSRYGGEEFLVALPQTTHTEALRIAEALRKEIACHHIITRDQTPLHVTASFGVATLSDAEIAPFNPHYLKSKSKSKGNQQSMTKSRQRERLIQNFIDLADLAMYEAKRNGRNRVESANKLIEDNKIPKPIFSLV